MVSWKGSQIDILGHFWVTFGSPGLVDQSWGRSRGSFLGHILDHFSVPVKKRAANLYIPMRRQSGQNGKSCCFWTSNLTYLPYGRSSFWTKMSICGVLGSKTVICSRHPSTLGCHFADRSDPKVHFGQI